MGRPEQPVDSQAGPAAELAIALRSLRRDAGAPSYRRMAASAGYSAATLARAASGRGLPSLEVTLAYAAVCGGERGEWARRWRHARQLALRSGSDGVGTGPDPAPVVAEAEDPAPAPSPAQLPAALPGFVGRLAELDRISAAALAGRVDGVPAPIVISGMAGIGKTTLAVQWARRAADRYRDGQLYIDLRGFTATPPLQPRDALARFLRALGVPPGQIPSDPEEAAAAYRTRLAAAQMLIVLDNAREADQVRPLLPGGGECTVLITSRDRLAGLAARDGAHLVALEPFTDGEAHDLLVRRLGHRRVADDSTATALARLCGHLPLALSIAAARLASSQHTSITELVEELRASHSPLDMLTVGDLATDIRQVISWSYHSLDAPAARMFRLLALHAGADVTVAAAASLGGVSTVQARQALRALTHRCLLHERTPGRFALHDLLRAYAVEQVTAAEPAIERDAAVGRLLGHYLHSAYLADSWLNPKRQRIALDRMPDGGQLVHHADSAQALAWFDAEHHNLLAASDLAAAAGCDRDVWRLSWAMATFLLRRGHTNDWITSQRAALSATQRLADAPAEARILLGLSRAYATAGHYEDARQYADRALTAYRRLGDRVGQGRTYLSLNLILTRQGRDEEALGVAVRALELFNATGDRHAQAAAHNAIGWYHARHGQRELASDHCTKAVQIFQDLGDPAGEAAAWDSLGHAHCRAHDYPGAVECYQRAVAGHRAAGAHRSHAGTLLHLSDAYDASGNRQAADRARQAASTVMAKVGLTRVAERASGQAAVWSVAGEQV